MSEGAAHVSAWSWPARLGGLLLVLVGLAGAVALVPTVLRQDRVTYEWEATWGATGGGPGELRGPIGVAVDDSGFVYVSDSGNDRIQKLTSEGAFVDAWDGSEDGRGRLRRPMHVDLSGDGVLRVPEYLADRVRTFGLDGAVVGVVSEDHTSPEGDLDAPGGVAAAPGGEVLWIPDFFHHRVAVFGSDGGYRRRIGSSGRWLPGRLHYPTDVAFGPDGSGYVADAYNHRIQRFSAEGEHLDSWGGPLGLGIPGIWKGWFLVATGVHVDVTGRVFVADFYNDRIQLFTADGTFLSEWGGPGAADGAFDRPTDVATGPDGRVYVADFGNDRIQVFRCPACETP